MQLKQSPSNVPEGGPRIAAEAQQLPLDAQPIQSKEIQPTKPIQAPVPVSPESVPSVPPVARAPFPSKSNPVSPTPSHPAVEAPAGADVLSQPKVSSQPATPAPAAEEKGGQSSPYSDWAVDAARKPVGTSKQAAKSVFDQELEDTASRMSSPVAHGKQMELEPPSEPSAAQALESPVSAKPPSKSTPRLTKEDAVSVVQQDLPLGLLYGQPSMESPLPSQEESIGLESSASADAAIPTEPQVFSSQHTQGGYVHPAMESAQIESAEYSSTQLEQQDIDYFEQLEYVRAESLEVQNAAPIDDEPVVTAEVSEWAPDMVPAEISYETEASHDDSHLIAHAPQCPNCSISLEPNARFCGECGFHLGTRIPSCPLCSAPLELSAKFCGECGSNIGPSQSPLPSGPGGMPGAPTQHGWLVKFLKILEN